MVYHNGKPTVYAKKSKKDGKAEPGTKKFYSKMFYEKVFIKAR